MRDIVIVGAGSVGGHIAANPELYNLTGSLRGFVDDDPAKIGTFIEGLPVLGNIEHIFELGELDLIIGIAFPHVKSTIVNRLRASNKFNFPTLIAKNAWVSNNCTIGMGSIIYPGTSINYGTQVGEFCVFNMNCAVGHHVEIGNFTSLAPGVNIGGNTSIGEACDLGIGCSLVQHLAIGANVIIGGQAMLLKDVEANAIMVGVPAKRIK